MRRLGPLIALFLIVGATVSAEQFDLVQDGKIVRMSDPQISPDGRSVVIVVSRANFEVNRHDVELVLVDAASCPNCGTVLNGG